MQSSLDLFEVTEVTENQQNNTLQEAQMLADLASYQKGSIVSREIIRKSTGTVTFFAILRLLQLPA